MYAQPRFALPYTLTRVRLSCNHARTQIKTLDGATVDGHEWCFLISCPPVHFTVRAKSSEEREFWLHGLQSRATKWRDKLTPSTAVCLSLSETPSTKETLPSRQSNPSAQDVLGDPASPDQTPDGQIAAPSSQAFEKSEEPEERGSSRQSQVRDESSSTLLSADSGRLEVQVSRRFSTPSAPVETKELLSDDSLLEAGGNTLSLDDLINPLDARVL